MLNLYLGLGVRSGGTSRRISPTNREKRGVIGNSPEKFAEFEFIFMRARISFNN